MTGAQERRAGALDALDRLLAAESEADVVLRRTVDVLCEQVAGYAYVALSFVEERELVLGPWRGEEPADDVVGGTLAVPVTYDGNRIGELRVAAADADVLTAADAEFLGRVAQLVSAHCLVGWDTGGVPWSEVQ